jgi:hypothetical protein
LSPQGTAVTGRIFQAMTNFCPHRQKLRLLLFIRLTPMSNKQLWYNCPKRYPSCTLPCGDFKYPH